MMPYQSYQDYEARRPKTAAEIRRADEQLGRMAENISWLWQHVSWPLALLRGQGQGRRPARSALLGAER